MRIDSLIVCNGWDRLDAGRVTILAAGTDTFEVEEGFPFEATVPIVVGTSGVHDTLNHTLRAQVHDPEMALIEDHSWTVKFPDVRPVRLPAAWDSRLLLTVPVPVTVPQPGPYLLTVWVDEDESRSHPIFFNGR